MTQSAHDMDNYNIGQRVKRILKDRSKTVPGFPRLEIRNMVGYAPGVVACLKDDGTVLVVFHRDVWQLGKGYKHQERDTFSDEYNGIDFTVSLLRCRG